MRKKKARSFFIVSKNGCGIHKVCVLYRWFYALKMHAITQRWVQNTLNIQFTTNHPFVCVQKKKEYEMDRMGWNLH